ncbi:GNAT family N-acetyltransferase [Actinoallomurus sp. CA-142502]|uniref:GNAT family N-acetyltransferase n=1 Tax=Actinoallomurus sp. CA-142502 TaxID=3239885 RepID=UPI003D917390
MTNSAEDVLIETGAGDHALSARLNQELHDYNVQVTGADDQAELSVRAVDADGELVGGLTGWTWAGCGGVELLWVRADRRGESWGRALMGAAETEARRRGCTQMIVSTLSFQAPGFYRSLGYVETGRTEGHPIGHADLHFTKQLGPAVD